jgi:uncharacterized membrane protein
MKHEHILMEGRSFLTVILLTTSIGVLTAWLQPGASIPWGLAMLCMVLVPLSVFALSSAPLPAANRLFWSLLLVYAVIHLAFETLMYYTGVRAMLDTAAFVQSFWNFIHKGVFETTLDGQYSFVAPRAVNHFARHNSPILFLPLLFYAVYPVMITLIVFKTISLVLTGWLAMRLVFAIVPGAKERPLTAFLPFVLLLQVPLFLMTDFDETFFFPPLFLWSALAFQTCRRWQFVVSCLLFAAIKETTVPILLVWSFIAFVRKREIVFLVAPAIIAAITFTVSFFVVIPHFNVGVSSPFLAEVQTAMQKFDLKTVGRYFFLSLSAWGWMVFGSPVILLALPDMFMNAFFSGSWPWVVDLGWRYQMVVFSAFFVGLLESLPRVVVFVQRRFNVANAERGVIAILLTLTVLGLNRGGGRLHSLWDQLHRDWKMDLQCIEMVARTHDPVVADSYLCAYFSERDQLWATTLPGFPLSVLTDSVWYVDYRESDYSQPAIAHWDTVCSSGRVFVLRKPRVERAVDTTKVPDNRPPVPCKP